MARCRPAPEGWGDLARWLRCSSVTDRFGYAPSSRLASEPNPLQQNRKYFLHRPYACEYLTDSEHGDALSRLQAIGRMIGGMIAAHDAFTPH